MEAGEYGPAPGTCLVAHHFEVVAVDGILRLSWRVLGAARFRVFFSRFVRTHTACCKYEAALHYFPLF